MPLKTPEEKKNAIKWLVIQLKTFGVGFVACVGAAWGVGEVYLEDYTREVIDTVLEERKENKSFRQILGEEMDIPTDMVPYILVEKINSLDSLMNNVQDFQDNYLPYLDFQLEISPMYRYIDNSGVEWWMGPDKRPHGVLYDDSGKAWCVYSNQKKIIGDSY